MTKNIPQFEILNPVERSRKYHFADGTFVKFKNVVKLYVSSRGTHRLETTDGKKYLIPAGFRYIELDADKWTL